MQDGEWQVTGSVHNNSVLLLLIPYSFPAPAWVLPQAAVLQDKPAAPWGFKRLWFLQEIPACSRIGSSTGCSAGICSMVAFHGLQGNICSTMVSPGAVVEALFGYLEHLLLISCSHFNAPRAVSHFSPSLLNDRQHFTLSYIRDHRGTPILPWGSAAPCNGSIEEAPASLHRSHSCSHCCQCLYTSTWYIYGVDTMA